MRDPKNMSMAIAFAAAGVLVILTCMTRHYEFDLWWHLKLGEFVAVNKAMPLTDTFSHTFAGGRQYAGEWLADLILYAVFHAGGFLGLNIFKAAIVLLTLGCIALTIKIRLQDKAEFLPTVVITLIVVLFAIRFRLFVRPYLFTMLFTALFLYLLEIWRDRRRQQYIYCIPLFMLLWANLSVGAVFGVLIVVLAAAVDYREQRSLKLPGIALLTALASLLSPEGTKLYTLAFGLTTDPYRALVPEYSPLTVDLLWGSGFGNTLPFQLLAVGALLYLLWLRGWKNLLHVGLYGFFLYEACRQFRLIEIFSVVVAPFFAVTLAHALARINAALGNRPLLIPGGVMLLTLTAVPLTVFYPAGYTFGSGLKPGTFPEGALRFLDQNRINGKLFNSYSFGGYFIWQAPQRPVFIDGRYRRLYTPEFAGEFLAAITSAAGWQAAERKYGFDYAVLTYDFPQRPIPAHLAENPAWAIVYWDKNAVVAVRRTPEREELLRKFAYEVSRPTALDFRYLDSYVREGTIDQALIRLEAEIARDRENQVPLLAALYLLHQAERPDLQRILSLFAQLMPLQPDFAMKHSGYAQILLETGQSGKGRQELARALALDPADPGARALAARFQATNSGR